MDNNILLSLKNLKVWYIPNHNVLSDFSLDLWKNEVIGLIGLNGSGKTTFIKTIAGLIPNYYYESATWNDNSFSFRDKEFKLNRYVVFSEDHSFQYFNFVEYLAYVCSSYGVPLPDVSELVKGFCFENYTNVILKDLSTGNLRKVFLITAFALKPKLLLLDEPVNGLDFQSTEYLYQLIKGYKKYGTLLFSSHILESICLTSDRVFVLENGKINHIFTNHETTDIRKVLNKYENY